MRSKLGSLVKGGSKLGSLVSGGSNRNFQLDFFVGLPFMLLLKGALSEKNRDAFSSKTIFYLFFYPNTLTTLTYLTYTKSELLHDWVPG